MINRMHRFPIIRTVILSLTVGLLTGCGAGFTSINGRDDGVLFPSLRVSYPIFDQYDLHGQSYYAVEAGVSRGRGEGHQALSPTDEISLAGTILPGPADVRQDFTLDVEDVALRARFPREALFFMEVLVGYRYKDLDLRLQSNGLSAQREFRDGAFAAGIGVGSRVSDRLMLDLRFVLDFTKNNGQLGSADFTASYWLSPYTAITAGYRRWEYGRYSDVESDIDTLVWQGFCGGLAFSF